MEAEKKPEENENEELKVDVGMWPRWNKKFMVKFKEFFKSTTRKEENKK